MANLFPDDELPREAAPAARVAPCELPDDPDVLDALRLTLVPGIGPRLQQALLAAFGSPSAIMAASRDQLLQVDGIGPKLASAVIENRDPIDARREWNGCRSLGVSVFVRGKPPYPKSLASICDPPLALYCKGELLPRDELAVAIVGSRRCTHYGKRQAERLARALASAGLTIVSGLARGIDGAAHRGALDAGGRTIAVTATGLASVYPPEHASLAEEIARQGAVIAETPLGQQPVAGLFPQRNRIISGISLGVVIVEAARKSGALHTARHAMEQGRDVFVVPGHIDSLESEGCHDLIRDGATLVRGPDDVLEGLGPLIQPVQRTETEQVRTPRELTLNDQEREVLNFVGDDPRQLDEIVRTSKLETARVMTTLTVLEMKRMVRRLPGGMFVRIPR